MLIWSAEYRSMSDFLPCGFGLLSNVRLIPNLNLICATLLLADRKRFRVWLR